MRNQRTVTGVVVGAVAAVSVAGLVLPPTNATDPGAGDFAETGRAIAGDFWDPQTQHAPTSRALSTRAWPSAASMITRLKARGVTPNLIAGYNDPVWEQHAFLDDAGTSVNAVMMHDTGTSVPASRLRNTHSLDWIVNGVKNSRGQTVRACHLYVARNGDVYVVYARRTWHAGAGDSMFGIPSNRMNGYSYGIEIESQGGGIQDLTAAQITSASRVAAALLDISGLGIDRVINHKDYAGRVQGKVDTAYPASFWRTRIAAVINSTGGSPTPSPTPTPTPSPTPQSNALSNPLAISLSQAKPGMQNTSVQRYQVALRAFAKSRKLPVNRINRSGPTGYYGNETQSLTIATYNWLRGRIPAWRRVPTGTAYPVAALIRKIGRVPVG